MLFDSLGNKNILNEFISGNHADDLVGKLEIGNIVIMFKGFIYTAGAEKTDVIFPYSTEGLVLCGCWFTNFYNSNEVLLFSYSGVTATKLSCNARNFNGNYPGSNKIQAMMLFRKVN